MQSITGALHRMRTYCFRVVAPRSGVREKAQMAGYRSRLVYCTIGSNTKQLAKAPCAALDNAYYSTVRQVLAKKILLDSSSLPGGSNRLNEINMGREPGVGCIAYCLR